MGSELFSNQPHRNWFIGIEVYGPGGKVVWIARGPYDLVDDLNRVREELSAINKRFTRPFQAASLEQAMNVCRKLGVEGQVL